MTNIPRFATHNEYPNDSIEGMDLQHLLHPSTNLAQHQQHGPLGRQRTDGINGRATDGQQHSESRAGRWCTAR